MTTILAENNPAALWNRLSKPLLQVAHRQRRVTIAIALLKMLIVALVLVLAAAMLLGTFPGLWMPGRVMVAGAVWLVALCCATRLLWPLLDPVSLQHAAALVEEQSTDPHERIRSAVELWSEPHPLFRGSPDLVAQLMEEAAADAEAISAEQVVRMGGVVRWSMLFVPVFLAGVILAVFSATRMQFVDGLYRLVLPWQSNLPRLLSPIVVQPGDAQLVAGDPLDIRAQFHFYDVNNVTLLRQFENGQSLMDQMQLIGRRNSVLHLDNLQDPFRYQIISDSGNSRWYTVAVHPRPRIDVIDVRCDYPKYTQLSPTISSTQQGTVEAVIGTHVTLTVHTQMPIVVDRSLINIDEGAAMSPLRLERVNTNDLAYQTQFFVNHSGHYQIALTNPFGLNNENRQARAIVALPDAPPTIIIRSPDAEIVAGPDDTVPVQFDASDDYGIARIEALLQLDDRSTRTVLIPFKADDKRSVSGEFNLAAADVLKEADLPAGQVHRIAYQLKAIDTREPDPQSTYSARHLLQINPDEPASYQARINERMGHDLETAVRTAIDQLDRERPNVEAAQAVDMTEPLDSWRQQHLHESATVLARASRDLKKAADRAMPTPFEATARTLEDIASGPMQLAAENATRADLNSNDGHDRKDSITTAMAQIGDARQRLQAILDKQEILKQQHAAEAALDLADAARNQQDAAKATKSRDQTERTHDPGQLRQQHQAMQEQQRSRQQLQRAMQQVDALRDPQATETAQRLQDLIGKVEEIERLQEQVANQTRKQQSVDAIAKQANELAQKQEALNKNIGDAAARNKQIMDKAGVSPPAEDQLDIIIRDLNSNQLDPAHNQMKWSIDQLQQAARQLQQSGAQAVVDELEAQLERQQWLASAVEQKQKELTRLRNDQSPEQNAQEQKQIADRAISAQQQASQLQQQAEGAQNAKVSQRVRESQENLIRAQQKATDAGRDQLEAEKQRQEAASAQSAGQASIAEQHAERSLENAVRAQQQALAALAKTEESLRDISGRAQARSTDPLRQAAQSAQEASQAQQEALQQSPSAAQQAARALNDAAQAMALTLPGNRPGQDQTQSGDATHARRSSSDLAHGISPAIGAPLIIPAAVRDLGISADQWASLPELVRADLMSAAQQSAPLRYREMIRDYYLRVVKMRQSDEGPAVGK